MSRDDIAVSAMTDTLHVAAPHGLHHYIPTEFCGAEIVVLRRLEAVRRLQHRSRAVSSLWWASSARDIGEERDHEVMSAAEAKAVAAAAGGGGGGVIVIDEKDMGAVRRGGGGGGGGGEDKGLALDVEGAGLTRRRLV